MVVFCSKCEAWFDDEFRTTICPHGAFAANDGKNNFRIHHDAFLATKPQPEPQDPDTMSHWQVALMLACLAGALAFVRWLFF